MARPASPVSPPAPQTRTTIDDVAREAGVSKATVSRVLNRRDELLTRDIAERVQAAIDRLGYSPSPMAQALKRGRSRLIGLVVADVANPFSVAVLRGAEKACRDAGYMVMLFNLGNDDVREREAIQALSSYQVEGFILHTLGRDAAALDAATHRGKPVVLVDRRLGDAQLDLVGLDNAGAVRLAAGHLLDAGYRHLLFVTESMKGVSSREERAAAFRAFIADQAPARKGTVFESAGGDEDALDAQLRDLKRRAGEARPAVLSANAVITLRIAAAAARLGWSLGSDLGLVGFDDPDWAPLVGPGLSTIAQPTDDIGRLAARCLIERIEGQALPPRQILLPGRLVVRGSSRP
ncbi:MAG: LacI family DNA-binding transcriptional regulator [Burkholderiaceae bacterium]